MPRLHRLVALLSVPLILASAAAGGGAQQDTSAGRRARTSGTGSVTGLVIDSIHGGPLVGAQVMVEGVNDQVATDSGGRFRLDGVPAGAHRVGVFHPLLDSLGLSLASRPLTVVAGESLAVMFATPSAQSAVALLCRAAVPNEGSGPSAIIGHVLDADTDEPLSGVRVSVSWTEIQVSTSAGLHRIQRTRDTATGPDGGFLFCYMPAGLNGLLRATRAAEEPISRPYVLSGQPIGLVVLHVPIRASGAAAAASTPDSGKLRAVDAGSSARSGVTPPASRPGATLIGRVARADGAPVAGARALILGGDSAVTSDSGQFTIHGLLAGTRTLVVRAVGWEPVETSVELTTRETRRVSVALTMKTAVLQAVLVTARLNAGLQSVGFDQRKKVGIGRFLSAEEIQKRNVYELHDLIRGMPGVQISYGRDGRARVSGTRGSGSCVGYVVDGMPFREMEPGDIDNYVRPTEIGAVEVYQASEGPVFYRSTSSSSGTDMTDMRSRSGTDMRSGTGCVTVVIWTKTRLGL